MQVSGARILVFNLLRFSLVALKSAGPRMHSNQFLKAVVVLNIPDSYSYMDPDLVDLIKGRCAKFIPQLS
jgi:predicted protein tyrosine phosphatase